jgi:hypothetical protein
MRSRYFEMTTEEFEKEVFGGDSVPEENPFAEMADEEFLKEVTP